MNKLNIGEKLLNSLQEIKEQLENNNPQSELLLATADISCAESHCDGSCVGKCTKSCQKGCVDNCGRYLI